jgi:hypothetical protein
MSERIAALCLMYLYVESVFCAFLTFLGVSLRKIVRVGRWSVMGGEIVPAMVCVAVRVVSVGSMSVGVLWNGSQRVGVVIVVRRLFSVRRLVSG